MYCFLWMLSCPFSVCVFWIVVCLTGHTVSTAMAGVHFPWNHSHVRVNTPHQAGASRLQVEQPLTTFRSWSLSTEPADLTPTTPFHWTKEMGEGTADQLWGGGVTLTESLDNPRTNLLSSTSHDVVLLLATLLDLAVPRADDGKVER